MSKRKQAKLTAAQKKGPAENPDIPQSMFDEIVLRLDRLSDCWLTQWPDGINPKGMLEKRHGHLVRAYRGGVRARSLYDAMVAAADWLDRNGGCCKGAGDVE